MEILYEKAYPREDLEEIFDRPVSPEEMEQHTREMDEKLGADRRKRLSVVPIPERKEPCVKFVRAAIEAAEAEEVDIRVTKAFCVVIVEYSFPCYSAFTGLGKVMAMADEVAFVTEDEGREIVIQLEYQTHSIEVGDEA